MPPSLHQIIHFFNFIGSLVCHQRPERTLIIGGQHLPVCARCTGGYLGFLVGYVVLLFRRKDAKGPPSLWMTMMLSTPMIIDVFMQVLYIRESTNSWRLLTGLFFGVATLPFLVYVLQLVPITRRLPVFSHVSPKSPQIDDFWDPWISSKALFLGALICLLVFFVMIYSPAVSSPLLYWIITPPLVFSIILHIFLLPPLLLVSAVYEFLSSRISPSKP